MFKAIKEAILKRLRTSFNKKPPRKLHSTKEINQVSDNFTFDNDSSIASPKLKRRLKKAGTLVL